MRCIYYFSLYELLKLDMSLKATFRLATAAYIGRSGLHCGRDITFPISHVTVC